MDILTIIDKLFIKKKQVNYINGTETLLPPLTKEEEEKYTKMYLEGDIKGRNKLIEHNLRLVVYVAKKFETKLRLEPETIEKGLDNKTIKFELHPNHTDFIVIAIRKDIYVDK